MVSEVGPASISVERAPERIGYGGSEEARSAHNKERGDRDDANERVSGWNPLKDPRSPNQAEVSRLSPPVKRRRSERSPSIGSSRSGHQPPSAHEEEDELDETARDGYSTRRSTARHYLARHHDSNPRKTPRLSDPEWASSSKQRSASGKMSEQDRVDRAASPGAAYHTSNGGPDRWQSSMRRQERAESRSANDDAMMLRRAATHPRSHHGEDYRPSMSSRPGSSGKRSASGSSTGDMPPSAADPRDRNEAAAYRRERGEDPRDADYVWNSGTTPGGGVMSIAALNGGGGAGASGISSRGNTLPPLGVRSMPPVPSATSRSLTPSTHQMQQSRFPPSPRLPSFAALQQPDTPASAGTSVTLSTTSNGSTIATTAMSNPDQSGSVHQGMPGRPLSQLPPFMGSQPISNADRSPSQSSSHAAGHPLIHPSLAGLPGTGGGGSKQQPSFVSKLYSMLEDEAIEDMISWGSSGTVFSVANPAEFSKIVLPNWFKHSNWQSFVRQLNMYGFHKVNHTYQGNPADEVQIWEFRHPNFRRGEIHLLNDIKRKSSRQKRTSSPNRSAGGTGDNNSRADSRGGTATPSPEIPLAAVSSHHALGPLKVIKTERGAGGPPDARMGPPPDGRIDTGRPQYIDVGTPGGYRDYGPPTSARIPMPPSERPMGPSPTSATMPPHPQSTGTYQPVMGGPVPASSPRAVQMSQASGLSDVQQDGGVMVRMDDLSDRIDQIIRHASYLESQLRTMSETVYQSQQSEATTRLHTLRMLNSITNVIGRYSSTDTNEGAETRHAMIEAVYGEIGQMQAYLQIDSAALSPPTLSTPLPGSRNAPMPPRYAPGMPPSAATQSSPGSGSAQGAGPGPGPGPGPSARPRGHGPPKGSSPPPPPPLSSCHRLDSQPSPGSGAHPHPQYGFAPAPFATSELGPVRTRDSPPRYRTR